jgi:hypothetical protein
MRITAHPLSKLPGCSKAYAYRNNLDSPTNAMRALVDAYGITAVIQLANVCHNEIAIFGDVQDGGIKNTWLNSLPIPVIRVQPSSQPRTRKRR